MKILVYLLPFAGELLLNRYLNDPDIQIQAAFLAEKYRQQSNNIIRLLDDKEVPYRFPGDLQAKEENRQWVEQYPVDLGVSVGYDQKLPPWLIDHPTHGTLNIHPSLLPRYRGANPYFWVIRNRESTSGVTLHWMNERFDRGPILGQEVLPIRSDETMGTLYFRLHPAGLDLLDDVLQQLLKEGVPPNARPQGETEEDLPTAPEVKDQHRRLVWEESAADIEAHIRAGNPHYPALVQFNGFRTQVFQATVVDHAEDSGLGAGRVIGHEQDRPLVACGEGTLRLDTVCIPNQGVFEPRQLASLGFGEFTVGTRLQ